MPAPTPSTSVLRPDRYRPIDISGLVAGIFVIGVVQGAYSTEVLRGAIKAMPPGRSRPRAPMACRPSWCMRRITLPAMLPYAIPGLSNLWLIATKDTALLAVVGFSELTLVTRQAAGATKAYVVLLRCRRALSAADAGLQCLHRHASSVRARRGMPSVKEAR